MLAVWGRSASHALTVYESSLERAGELLARAEIMPIRRIFADGQLARRRELIDDASRALEDAADAAAYLEDPVSIRLLAARSSLVDASRAPRMLIDDPEFVAFRLAIEPELERVRDIRRIVTSLRPDARPDEQVALQQTVRDAMRDREVRERLGQALLTTSKVDAVLRAGVSPGRHVHMQEAADAYGRLLRGLVDPPPGTPRVLAPTWSDEVFAPSSEYAGTYPEEARPILRAVRSELDALHASEPAARDLRAATGQLIDEAELRLSTNVGEGAGLGYLDNPDYADLGRIRANLRLLRAIDEVARAPAAPALPAPATQAADVMLAW